MSDIKTTVSTIKSGSGRNDHFSKTDIGKTIEKIKSEIASGNYSNASQLAILQQLQSDAVLNAIDGLTTGKKDGFYQVDELIAAAKISTDSKTELTEKDLGLLKRNSFVPAAPRSGSSPPPTSTTTSTPTSPPPPGGAANVTTFSPVSRTPNEIQEYIKKACEKEFLGKVLSEGSISELCELDSFSFGGGKICKPFFNPRTEKLHLLIYDQSGDKNATITELTVSASDGSFGGNIHLGLSQDAIANPGYYLKARAGEKIILGTKGISREDRAALTRQVFENYFKGRAFADIANGNLGTSVEIRKVRGLANLTTNVTFETPEKVAEKSRVQYIETPSSKLRDFDTHFIGKINSETEFSVVGQSKWFVDNNRIDQSEGSTSSKIITMKDKDGKYYYLYLRSSNGSNYCDQIIIPAESLQEVATDQKFGSESIKNGEVDFDKVIGFINKNVDITRDSAEAYKRHQEGFIQIGDLKNVRFQYASSSRWIDTNNDGHVDKKLSDNAETTSLGLIEDLKYHRYMGVRSTSKSSMETRVKELNTKYGYERYSVKEDPREKKFKWGIVDSKPFRAWYGQRVRNDGDNGNGIDHWFQGGATIDVPKVISNTGEYTFEVPKYYMDGTKKDGNEDEVKKVGISAPYSQLQTLYSASPSTFGKPQRLLTIKPDQYHHDDDERQIVADKYFLYVVSVGKHSRDRVLAIDFSSDLMTEFKEYIGLEDDATSEEVVQKIKDLSKEKGPMYEKMLVWFAHKNTLAITSKGNNADFKGASLYDFKDFLSTINELIIKESK